MPSLNASLAWAVPVDIVALGPHIEAYAQPTITALRLCHRFGRSSTPISRLPVELVSNIEEILMSTEREKQREAWKEAFQCFRGLCSPRDHYTKSEMDEIRGRVAQWYECDCDFDEDDDVEDRIADCECFEETVEDFLVNSLPWEGVEYETHRDRSHSWRLKVQDLSTRTPLLTQSLGVSLWTSTIRLSGKSTFDDYFPDETTIAYLILATNAPSVESSMDASQLEREMDEVAAVETGCVMDVMEHHSRPEDAEHRFKRAMRILDVKVCDPCDQQKEAARSREAQNEACSNTQHPKKSWPRLTVLMSTAA